VINKERQIIQSVDYNTKDTGNTIQNLELWDSINESSKAACSSLSYTFSTKGALKKTMELDVLFSQ
jgi:hypothetical protein